MAQQQMEDMIDLTNRDPNSLNNNLQVEWSDVFAEPDSTHSIDCLWTNSYKCFTCSKNCCYKLITTLCGLCIALEWGCCFAEITFHQVWCATPGLRAFSIYATCCQKYLGVCVQCCLAPLCETASLCFSQIHVTNK